MRGLLEDQLLFNKTFPLTRKIYQESLLLITLSQLGVHSFGISESMEHILNELEDLFQSLVRRMNKSEMEDFELVN